MSKYFYLLQITHIHTPTNNIFRTTNARTLAQCHSTKREKCNANDDLLFFYTFGRFYFVFLFFFSLFLLLSLPVLCFSYIIVVSPEPSMLFGVYVAVILCYTEFFLCYTHVHMTTGIIWIGEEMLICYRRMIYCEFDFSTVLWWSEIKLLFFFSVLFFCKSMFYRFFYTFCMCV